MNLNEGDTVVYLMKHDDNGHWWMVEDGKGQVGYVPAAYLMIIIDETHQEESESESESFYSVLLQTQDTSAKTISGRCRRGHLEKVYMNVCI